MGDAAESAYRRLHDDIIEWRLEPGRVLGEVEQAARLGVSRTPVREALARLVADGLVSNHRGRGLVVSPVSLGDVEQLYELRQAIEQAVARAAARRRDPGAFSSLREALVEAQVGLDVDAYYALVARVDEAIGDAANNAHLTAAVRALRPHLARIRRLAQDDPARLRASAAEHLLIVDAIIDGDADLAAAATQTHLRRSLRHLTTSRKD